MKKMCIVLVFLYWNTSKSQTKPTLYFINDASITTNNYLFINPGVYQTIGKWGVFCEAVFENDVWSVAPGVLFSIQPKNKESYQEFGAGIGFEQPYLSKEVKTIKYLNTYYYLEIFSSKKVEDTKVLVSLNISYANEWGIWRMGSIVYYPTKRFGFGFKTQSYAVDGLYLQYKFSKKLVPNITIGHNGHVQVGLSTSLQKTFN